MRVFLKLLICSLACLSNAGHATQIFLDPAASGQIYSGGLDIFDSTTSHQRPLSQVSFYDFDGGMPGQNGAWSTLGYALFDGVPEGFTVQNVVLELDIESAYFFPFFFQGMQFPNGSGLLSINVFGESLVEALDMLPEGELVGDTAPSALAQASRQFATRSGFRNTDFSTGIAQFDFNQSVTDALNENPGPFGVSLELTGVIDGRVILRNPGRLILEGEFATVPVAATLPLLLLSLFLQAIWGRSKNFR